MPKASGQDRNLQGGEGAGGARGDQLCPQPLLSALPRGLGWTKVVANVTASCPVLHPLSSIQKAPLTKCASVLIAFEKF